MFARILKKFRGMILPAILLAAIPGVALWLTQTDLAFASAASAKAATDAAKAQGIVGEQGDGYLGLVTGSADASVSAAVAEINAGRRAVYQDTATKTGVSLQAAGEATAVKLFEKVPSGQYIKPLGGSWTRK